MIRLESRHSVNTYYVFSDACAIPEEAGLVITGGPWTLKTVSRYNFLTGWVEDLAELNVKRESHGCSSYYKDGAQVSICKSVIIFVYLFIKILLVAGGYDGDSELASTEIYYSGSWREVGELSHPVYGVSGARLGNTVFMTGELSGC